MQGGTIAGCLGGIVGRSAGGGATVGNGGRGGLRQQQGTMQAVSVSHGERRARPGVNSQAQQVRPDRAWLLPRQQKSLLRIQRPAPQRNLDFADDA